MQKYLAATLTTFLLIVSAQSHASLIVNTGPGVEGSGVGGLALTSTNSLAGQFTIDQDWKINSVEGWINAFQNSPTTATVGIYSDGGDVPGSELYSAAFESIPGNYTYWQGATGLDWLIGAGTYWITFEVLAGQTMSGAVVGGAPSPLDETAYYSASNGAWVNYPSTMGMRIDATSVPGIPLPATIALVGLGLVALTRSQQAK
jgi:hypothetical protein